MSDNNAVSADRPARQVDLVRHALERMKPQFAMALPKHISPDRLIRIAMTSVQRTPKLLECDRQSFYAAIMMCAQLGLEPDGFLGQAYLIPYKGRVQLLPGYKGLLTLARNSGEISYIAAHEVRENDQFDFDFASGTPPVHKFSLKEDRGEVIAFYAIARFRDGACYWDMMNTGEINLIRDNSDGYRGAIANAKRYNKEPESPWISHYDEMAKKTVIRRISKYLPLSVQKASEIDAQVNAGVHVSMDKYGDVVIEHEAQPDATPGAEAEAVAQPDKPTAKLDRFEQMYGTVVDNTGIDNAGQGEPNGIPYDDEIPYDDTPNEVPTRSAVNAPAAVRPGDVEVEPPLASRRDGPSPEESPEASPEDMERIADANTGRPPIVSEGIQTRGPEGEGIGAQESFPNLSDEMIESRRRELRRK